VTADNHGTVSTRPDVLDMVRELCEPTTHMVRYAVEQPDTPGQPPRSKGRTRRKKAGRAAGRAPRYHRTVAPPLLEQLWQSIEPSGSAEAGVARPAASKPAARLDAIDTAQRIDAQVGAWLDLLDSAPARAKATGLTESELRLLESVNRLRHLASLIPGLDHCGNRPTYDQQGPICCNPHEIEHHIHRWWTWARVVTGWDTPAWQPANTCPLCGTRSSLRVRLDDQRATCINDACRETWGPDTIGLLAEHIRRENNDTEVAP
jgi:hypothetical protein